MVKYTNEYLKKKNFVKDHLEPMLMSIYPDIDEVQYEVTGARLELVHIIYYQDPIAHCYDHCIDTVNVTGDSLIAIVNDVSKAMIWR